MCRPFTAGKWPHRLMFRVISFCCREATSAIALGVGQRQEPCLERRAPTSAALTRSTEEDDVAFLQDAVFVARPHEVELHPAADDRRFTFVGLPE